MQFVDGLSVAQPSSFVRTCLSNKADEAEVVDVNNTLSLDQQLARRLCKLAIISESTEQKFLDNFH